MASFQPIPWLQVSDDIGFPLIGGKIFTYISGTTTLKTTYTDAALTVPNLNPIILNARGEAQMALAAGAYSIKLLRFDDTLVRTIDNVTDPILAGIAAAAASDAAIRSDLVASTGSNMVGFIPTGAGAVARTAQSRLRDVVNASDYADLQTALNTGVPLVFVPSGTKTITATLAPAAFQTIQGESREFGGGTIFQAAAGLNAPMVKFTSAGAIKNISLTGSATSALPLQALVHINNTNQVTIKEVFLVGGYDGVKIDGTSFFTSIMDCIFYNNYNSQLFVNSASTAGVDLIMNGCRFLNGSATMKYCLYFNGLGSAIVSDCQVALNDPVTAGVCFDQPAPLFGGAQFTNCVFENGNITSAPSVYVKGSSTNKWNTLRFTNFIVTGNAGIAVRADYASGLYFDGGTLSSVNTQGNFYIPLGGIVNDFSFNNVDFEGNAGIVPIQSGAATSVSGTIMSPRWGGFAPLVDFSACAPGVVSYLNVFGGSPGSSTNAINLNGAATVPGVVLFNQPWTAYFSIITAITGSLSAASTVAYLKKIGNTMHVAIVITITTNGTGAGGILVSLPTNPVGFPFMGYGRASTVSGKVLQAFCPAGSNTVSVFNYDNTYPAVDGITLNITGTYQTA